MQSLAESTVYHVLGKSSQVGDYVVWEDDMLDFILGLHSHMPILPNLSRDLADPQTHYLILGLNFSDWLVRFFLRTARQSRLTDGFSRIDYIAETEDPAGTTDGMVMFFGTVDRKIQVITCDPRDFVHELADRWTSRFSGRQSTARAPVPRRVDDTNEIRSVFISYAREDELAARSLKEGLESKGLRVWFDRERLQNGTNYENALEDAVREQCWLFIAVVSRTTESEREAYFHLERNWAAKRAESWSDFDRGEFYHPVVIDETRFEAIKREPRAFQCAQRVRLIGGTVTDDFADRILQLTRQREE